MPETYSEKDYSDRLVAFVDILGFQRLIAQSRQEAIISINIIDRHLQHIINLLQKEYDKAFSIRLFSDCMCISCDYSNENLFYVVFELAFIQYYLAREGIFLRGALSRGNHFENPRMIFSQGLVNAYHIENKAIYPRIIIDNTLIGSIMENKDSYAPIYRYEHTKNFVIQSPDRYHSVDYLQMIYQEGMDHEEELQRHKLSIEVAVKRNASDSHIIDKYRWLAEYHNCKAKIVCTEEYDEPEIWESTVINIEEMFPNFRKIE